MHPLILRPPTAALAVQLRRQLDLMTTTWCRVLLQENGMEWHATIVYTIFIRPVPKGVRSGDGRWFPIDFPMIFQWCCMHVHKCSIDVQRFDRTPIGNSIEHLSKTLPNIHQTTIEYPSNIYRNLYRTSIEHRSNIYRTSIEHISNKDRTSIENE